MKLLTSKKAILSILGLSSVVVASTYRDIKSHTVAELKAEDDKEEMVVERSVASEEAPSKVAQINLPMNEENLKKINSTWEVSRIIGSDEKVVFDKFQNQEDSKKSIRVKMELIGNGVVRLDKDNEQVYRVSILTDFGTIAIFKKMNNGYEIIEARKVVKGEVKNNLETTNEETDLVLERALNQSKGNKMLMGADAVGQLTLKGNNLSNLSVTLHNQNGEDQSIEIDSADLMDGGAFKAEVDGEEVSGVLFNNGKEGYRLSFVTGKMAGAMLNFVSKSQFDSIQEKEELNVRDQMEQNDEAEQKNLEVQQAQAAQVEERKVEVENIPADQKLTIDEIKETAQQNGFAF